MGKLSQQDQSDSANDMLLIIKTILKKQLLETGASSYIQVNVIF